MDHQESRKLTRSKIFQQGQTESSTFTGDQHPLLNPLIVQQILEFCKVNNQDDNPFPSLRLVCKLWDEECTKVLRRETQIPIPRLIEPYPDGLRWTLNRLNPTTGLRHHYKCPLPMTREFENFHVTATCESFKNTRVHLWFSCMGYQVKSLRFTSALTCFHQNDFLADILYKWCPNLETLHLDGIQCFHSLLCMFEGKLNEFSSFQKCTIICEKLKTLIISVENDSDFKDCICKAGRVPETVYLKNKLTMNRILDDIKGLINFLPKTNPSVSPQSNALFRQFIETSDFEIFSQLLNEYPKLNGVDGGVLGHILETAPLEKLVIKNLQNKSQTEELILSLLCQPSLLRSTLEHLEFQNASLCLKSLKALRLLKCPLTTLRMDDLLWRTGSASCLQNVLKNCAETLINFEVGLELIIFGTNLQVSEFYLKFPSLPKLKSFTNRTIGLLHFCGLELLGNAPKLEKMCIHNLRCDWGCPSQKIVASRSLYKVCLGLRDPSIKGNFLKDLKITADVETGHLDILKSELPHLVNVELNIDDPLSLVLSYPESFQWENLESIALSFGDAGDSDDITKHCDEFIAKCFGKFECLKFLHLTFPPDGMTTLPLTAFTNGFSKLSKLRSLKIVNLCVLEDQKDAIENSVAHIPCVSFSNESVIPSEDSIYNLLNLRPHE